MGQFVCACAREGVDGVKGKARTGSEERSRSKGAMQRVGIQGLWVVWVNSIEVNSAAVLTAYLRL